MQRNRLTSNPILDSTEKSSRTRERVRTSARGRASERPFFSALILGMAALALAIGVFILTVTGSLREAFDLALSREEASVPSITVRPLSTNLPSQEAVIRELQHVEGVQGVTATFRGAFKPEEERHSPATRLPDTVQGTWSDLPGLEFPLPSGKYSAPAGLTGRLPQSALNMIEGPADINEAMIGYELAQRLGKQVGDTLVVNEYPLVIVGIWPPSALSPGNVVQVSYDTIRQWLPRSECGFDEMTIILATGYDAQSRMEVARRIWDQVPQVEVLSPAQEQAERRQAMLALDLVVLYSALLTVLVGGVTTVNATLMSTQHGKRSDQRPHNQRARETSEIFGVIQPLLAALVGGLAGLLVGWLATLGLNAYTVHHQARTLFIVTPRLAGGVALLSMVVGLAAGVWPALWTRLRSLRSPSSIFHSPSFILPALAVLGVALATPGVMLIGSLVESLYCSLDEGQRVAANRIGLEPTSSGVAYSESLAAALRRWPGILGIAVEAYGGTIVEDEERWVDRIPPSGIVYGFRPALSSSTLRPFDKAQDEQSSGQALRQSSGQALRQSSGQASLTVGFEGSDWVDFGLGVPYRVELWQGRDFQPGSLDEAVIGYDLAARQGLKVGDTLSIRDHDFTVVGIRERLVYGRMNDFNLRAEVSLEALRRVLGQPYAFGAITAFIPPTEREEDRELFLARLEERFSGVAVITIKDRLAEIARDFPMVESLIVEDPDDTLLRARLLYFGLLAGVAIPLWGLAGLGMMSGLKWSLAKSRPEIRLRKLLGASDGDILARWLGRAALWGGIGGLMGMGSGWLIIEAINLYTSSYQLSVVSYQRALTLIATPRLVVMTLVVTVLLGVIAGLGPAWQAARLSPMLSSTMDRGNLTDRGLA